MKNFLTFLTLLIILPALNATCQVWQHEETRIPEFTYNHQSLAKPEDMTPAQWVDTLETERDKADALGEITTHFESYTKEISATLAGKYGEVDTSPAKLIYSVMRTRHKFPGKRNMLSDFYGVNETTHTTQQASILAIDTMVTKAINSDNETFETQWAAVNAENLTSSEFIEAVKKYAEIHEHKSWNSILSEALEQFLTTNQTTTVLAKKVFDIFVPVHGNLPFGGEYKGWKVHTTSTIESLINFSPEGKQRFAEQEVQINARLLDLGSRNVFPEIYHRSAMADFSSEEITAQLELAPNTIVLEYMYDPTASLLFPGLEIPENEGIMRVFFSKTADSEIAEFLGRPYAKMSENMLSKIYASTINEALQRAQGNTSFEDISLLIKAGNAPMIRHVSTWLYEGKHGFQKDLVEAVKFCRKATDLGDKEAKENLPEMLFALSLGSIHLNAQDAMILMREAASLGHKMAQLTIAQMPPLALSNK